MRIMDPKQNEQKPSSSRKVLYIEDDASNRAVAASTLGKKYEVLFATNDREACELIRTHQGEIGIFLVDIELQESQLNGLQIIELLRGHPALVELPPYALKLPCTAAPIFVLTAYGDSYPPEKVFAAGADDMLLKPVDFHALERAITKAILSDVTTKK